MTIDTLRAAGNDVVLLDARSAADYAQGHLPNARHADLETQLSAARDPGADPARGGRHPLPPLERWLAQLGAWGIGPSTRVVVYDDQQGANAAARAWWMLRAIGHENVAVLDGDWRTLGTTTDTPSVDPLPPYPASSWQWPTVDADRVDALRRDPSWTVLDVRATPRFLGHTEPIDPIAGHIPGARNLPYSENLSGAAAASAAGTPTTAAEAAAAPPAFKSPEALRAQYERFLDGKPAERLVVHCGSGVTACHTLLALDAAGLPGASLYVGSWSEWCRNERPRNP